MSKYSTNQRRSKSINPGYFTAVRPSVSLLLTVKKKDLSVPQQAYVTRACLLRTPASTAALQRSLRTMFTNEDGGKTLERTESDGPASHPLCWACSPGGRSPSWSQSRASSSRSGVIRDSCGSGGNEWREAAPARAHAHPLIIVDMENIIEAVSAPNGTTETAFTRKYTFYTVNVTH